MAESKHDLNAGVAIRYLFGRREAIERIAACPQALLVGAVLVVITAIARNYDQEWIGDRPDLWLFGSLLFSLLSGTLLFLVLQGLFLRWRTMPPGDGEGPVSWGRQWVSFMGLFWMTAPVAWLYAIPFERFLDSLAAARANLWLLGLVATWRVILMARVVQVITRAPIASAVVWVLFPAVLEVFVVTVFGGAFASRMAASMGGLRNSPEEDLVLDLVDVVLTLSLVALPLLLVVGILPRTGRILRPFPETRPARVAWLPVAVAAMFWVSVAVPCQRELRQNATVEGLVAERRPREALDYLAARQPDDFAPARPLPPKAFELSVFEQLPSLFGAVREDDPEWVQAHLVKRLDEMCLHFRGTGSRQGDADGDDPAEVRDRLARRLVAWPAPDAEGWIGLLDGLARMPEGRRWVRENESLLEALAVVAEAPEDNIPVRDDEREAALAKWSAVGERLAALGISSDPPSGGAAASP